MKTKLLAIVLCILMLVQPTMAIGMVGMESAEEIVAKNPEQEQEETAELNAMAFTGDLILTEDFEDHEGFVVRDLATSKSASLTVDYSEDMFTSAAIRCGDQSANISVVDLNGNKVLKLEGGGSSTYRMITLDTSKLVPGTHSGVYTVKYKYYISTSNGSSVPSLSQRIQNKKWDATNSKWADDYITDLRHGFTPESDKWLECVYTFEIKDDGYMYYYPEHGNFTEYKRVLVTDENGGLNHGVSRFDIVLNYPSSLTDEALLYIDDFRIEHVPAGEFPSAAPENAVLYTDLERLRYVGSSVVKGNHGGYTKPGWEEANLYHGAGWADNVKTTYGKGDAQGRTWKITNGDGIDSLSVLLNNVNITKDGLYSISYKEYKDFDASVFKGTAGVRDLVIFYAQYDAEGTKINNPWCDSKIVVEETTHKWLDKKVSFKIYTENGKRYLKWLDSTGNIYEVTGASAGFRIVNRMGVTDEQIVAIRDAGTKPVIYFDDICVTYDAPIKATYVDKNGAVLEETEVFPGENIKLSHSNAGLTYAAQFDVNGVKYNDGDTYTIPDGDEEIIITAGRYEMPENAPVNSIVYEDFEHTVGAGFTTVHQPLTYVDEEVFADTIPTLGSYGHTDKSYGTVDGRSVVKINSIPAKSADSPYHGFYFNDFNLKKPGKYVFVLEYRTQVPTGAKFSNEQSNLEVYSTIDGKKTNLGENSTDFGSAGKAHNTNNEWMECQETLIVTEESGQLYAKGKAIDQINNYLWYMVKSVATEAENTTIDVYLDNMALQLFAPVTVNVVDEKGATLATYDVYQNDTITLPAANSVSYNATLTYGGNTYDFGGNFVVPADAASEITITAARKTMPAHLPANTVLYEDFQNRTVGANIASTAVTYTTEAFDGSTIYNTGDGSRASATYEYTPDSETNVAMKVVSSSFYGNGVYINIPDDIPVGKYTVVNHLWIDNDTLDINDADGDLDTTDYLNSIGEWCRVWYAAAKDGDDGYVGASPTINYNSEGSRKTWIEHSFNFDVYEEDGVKYVGTTSADKGGAYETHALVGENLYIKLHMTGTNAETENVVIYHDDVYITCVEPETFTATFVDENSDAFSYELSANSYDNTITLPSAEKMGIKYLVEFVGEDGNTYYPGMKYTLEDGVDTAEFVVKKTNVILFEEYDGSGDTQPTYKAGHLVADASLPAGSVKGHKSFVWQNRTSGSTQYVLQDLKLDTPGVYTFTADCTLEVSGGTVPVSYVQVAFQHSDWTALRTRITLTEENPYTQISGTLTVTEGEDGQLYFHHSGNGNKRLVSNYASTNYHVFGMKVGFDFGTYPEGTADADKKKYGLRFENFKITFDEYAPVNTGKASYRELNADNQGGPEGIRFAAYVSNAQREIASEYGFVVTLKDNLPTTDGVTDYTKLNLKGIDSVSATVTTTGKNDDGVTVVAAAAYNGTVDRVYVEDGKVFGLQGLYDTFYTAVLYGIDTEVRQKAVFVARPYAKIDGIYYYGDCHETSYNDVKAAAEAANANA